MPFSILLKRFLSKIGVKSYKFFQNSLFVNEMRPKSSRLSERTSIFINQKKLQENQLLFDTQKFQCFKMIIS